MGPGSIGLFGSIDTIPFSMFILLNSDFGRKSALHVQYHTRHEDANNLDPLESVGVLSKVFLSFFLS